MKQSTKLLCLVLALALSFSCFSVIGSAALVESEVSYDNIDDAALTAEQVADLALDLVDNDLLADMDTIDLSIIGSVRLQKIDWILADICNIRDGFIWDIGKGLIGNAGDLRFNALANGGDYGNPYQRAQGDLLIIKQLLQFINDNADILSKVAYGIDTSNGLDLGLISSFLSLGETGDLLANLPLFLTSAVYDMLIYGSYNDTTNTTWANESYPDTDTLGGMNNIPIKTLDGIAKQALLGLLLNPQDYEWEGEGKDAVKVWDANSKITSLEDFGVSTRDELWNKINPLALSVFQIIDNIAQPAIDKFGVVALNNNLKKALMEACEVEFNEIAKTQIKDQAVLDYFDGESYVSYIAYDALMKASNGVWYYTTLKSRPVDADGDGVTDTDAEEKEIYEKQRIYYRANFAAANEFASLINWDWKFIPSTSSEEGTTLVYKELTANGSIVSGISWLLKKVYDTALTEETQADFEALTGGPISDSNDNINETVLNLTKYVLGSFGEKIWGKNSPYADYTYESFDGMDLVDIIAMIGPSFFEDAMPQIILPKDAEGNYAFHDGVQLWEFAAVVLRELITGIAPNVNYDAVIFANGDVTSAEDRLFVEQGAEEWFKIIVNMGMDLAFTYLNNITNFAWSGWTQNISREAISTPIESLDDLPDGRWEAMLDEVIIWCINYISDPADGSLGLLDGITKSAVEAEEGPFNKLNFILNSILPLGIIGETYAPGGQLDVAIVVEGLKDIITNFNFNALLNLFGRNGTGYNLLMSTNLANAALTLVNEILALVFGDKTDGTDHLADEGISTSGPILQNVGGRDSTAAQSLDAVVSQVSLKATVGKLLTYLNARKNGILNTALPVVGKLIKGWGTEQEFKAPDIQLNNTYDLSSGATTAAQEVKIRNASEGVWRHYIDANGAEQKDKQYQVVPVSVSVTTKNVDGSAASYVTVTQPSTNPIGYGGSTTFTFSATGVPRAGALALFDVRYKVIGEDGTSYIGDEFSAKKYVWLNQNPSDKGANQIGTTSTNYQSYIYTPQYIGLSDVKNNLKYVETASFWRKSGGDASQTMWQTPSNAGRTQDGISMGTSGFGGTIEKDDVQTSISNWTAPFKGKTNPLTGQTYQIGDRKPNINFSTSNNYDTIKFTLFENKDFTYLDEKGENPATFSITDFAFDEATWKAANKQPGSNTTWSVMCGIKKTEYNAFDFKLIYYDDLYLSKLESLVNDELDAVRLADNYRTSGTSYATAILVAEDTTDDNGETVLRETNYATTGLNEAGVEVTTIDSAAAWAEYNTALLLGVQAARQALRDDGSTVWDVKSAYERLRVAANDVQYLRKNAAEMAENSGAADIDGAIDTLKADLATAEANTTKLYDYTDYKMYRLNRFNDIRDDANYYINLKADSQIAGVTEIDEYFEYNWMEENRFRGIVAGLTDAGVEGAQLEDTKANLLALLKSYDADEIQAKSGWLSNRKAEYGRADILDVVMTSRLLNLTEDRLIKRPGAGTYKAHLEDEIASAQNMITDSSIYTEASWANYSEALAAAQAALETDSQMQMFDNKYNLLVMRKRLVKIGEEADYTELNELIKQAQHALANQDLYEPNAYDFGRVLAELGMDEVQDANGYDVQLFPGSALEVQARGYGIDDQNKVDRAATALKEALARLKFKQVAVTGTGATVEDVTLVEADAEKDIEEVVAKVATIAANQNADAVKKLFSVSAESLSAYDITVSTDVNYTVDTDLEGFAGTNSTVTFYTTTDSGVKIPVATVKLVVSGDINGDGSVDVLDAAYGALIAQEKGELAGCYLLAGDMVNGDKIVNEADYGEIVNTAIA